ncbi:hypothetical protein E2C01_089013 [Portunus trituberculatus]|uniref:Uncharacterized protein n=1 Tax=Portunus trituberculatus TaxID=210409 RepID=A0A5B7JLD9_PORTR|nr:hypothetical protein [Portunus trituberculatus]
MMVVVVVVVVVVVMVVVVVVVVGWWWMWLLLQFYKMNHNSVTYPCDFMMDSKDRLARDVMSAGWPRHLVGGVGG